MQAALHRAAEAADRVSSRAGLVNLDIINTPLTAFCFMSREVQRENTRNTHVDVHQRVTDMEVEAVQWIHLHDKDVSCFLVWARDVTHTVAGCGEVHSLGGAEGSAKQ